MSEEEYFVHFAAAMFAAYRVDPFKTTLDRDIDRALDDAKVAAAKARDFFGAAADTERRHTLERARG